MCAGAGAIFFHMTLTVLKDSWYSSSGFQADTVSSRGESIAMHTEIQWEYIFMGVNVLNETSVHSDANCRFSFLIIFLGCVCLCAWGMT